MIIKCISRKSNVDQLIRYVLTDEKLAPAKESKQSWYVPGVKLTQQDIKHLESERMDAKLLAEFKAFKGTLREFVEHCMSKNNTGEKETKVQPIVIKNNIRARSVNGYIKEFEANEKFRQHSRIDSVKAYHTILSFSALDSKYLDTKVLKDIAQKYISLRAEQSLVVGAVHRDRDHTHIHLIQSGVQYCTGQSNRISRQQFHELKVAMQQYQKDKYPELIHSLPDHQKLKNEKTSEKDGEKNIKRNERTTDKDILLGLLETTYAVSTSREHFLTQLQDHGHVPYFRNGRFQGIKFDGERKFRINRLGYDEQKLMTLDMKKAREEKSLQELRQLRTGKSKVVEVTKSPQDEATKETDPEKRQEKLQELVNQSKAFEEKNGVLRGTDEPSKEETQLQELRSIRENRDQEMDRNDSFEQTGRDAGEDMGADNERDSKEDTEDSMDEDIEDGSRGSSQDDSMDDDGDTAVR